MFPSRRERVAGELTAAPRAGLESGNASDPDILVIRPSRLRGAERLVYRGHQFTPIQRAVLALALLEMTRSCVIMSHVLWR